jgi:hypothetical protein
MRTRILAQVTSNKTQSVRRTRASKTKRKEKQQKIKETKDTQKSVPFYSGVLFCRESEVHYLDYYLFTTGTYLVLTDIPSTKKRT